VHSNAITRAAMQNLGNQIWKSRISTSTKLKLYNGCILPVWFWMLAIAGQLPRGMYTRLVLSVNGVCESSNGTMCGIMMWDAYLSNHTYHLLFKHGVSPSSATLRECQTNQMPSRSYQLPPSPRRTGGDHQDVPIVRGWRLFSRTWNQWTCPWMKQSTWLIIVHSGDWCLRLVLHTHSGACQKWTNEHPLRMNVTNSWVRDTEGIFIHFSDFITSSALQIFIYLSDSNVEEQLTHSALMLLVGCELAWGASSP